MKTFLKWCEDSNLELPLVVDAEPKLGNKKVETRSRDRAVRSGPDNGDKASYLGQQPEASWNTKGPNTGGRKSNSKGSPTVINSVKLPPE